MNRYKAIQTEIVNGGVLVRKTQPCKCNAPDISAFVLSVGDTWTCGHCLDVWEVRGQLEGLRWMNTGRSAQYGGLYAPGTK